MPSYTFSSSPAHLPRRGFPPAMTTIDEQPIEILRHILGFLRDEDWDPEEFLMSGSPSDLNYKVYRDASLVCKRWQPLAQAFLWSRICIGQRTQLDQLVQQSVLLELPCRYAQALVDLKHAAARQVPEA